MNDQLRNLSFCPCCSTSIQKAKILFFTSMLGNKCAVLECPVCTLIYKELFPTELGLQGIYKDSYVHFDKNSQAGLPEINSAKQKLSRCRKLLSNLDKSKVLKLLDIGCGSGMFVNIVREMGYQADGIDPYLTEELQSEYLWKKSPAEIAHSSYDIAVLLNVAEHLDEPKSIFQDTLNLLKPSGVMLLTCPYGNSLARRFHKDRWSHLALEEHLLFWNPQSLTYLLKKIGFQGKVSYRISGSPFPYGIVQQLTDSSLSSPPQKISNRVRDINQTNIHPSSLQSKVWEIARLIQKQEMTSNIVRSLIDFTHLGDYLEYAICVS